MLRTRKKSPPYEAFAELSDEEQEEATSLMRAKKIPAQPEQAEEKNPPSPKSQMTSKKDKVITCPRCRGEGGYYFECYRLCRICNGLGVVRESRLLRLAPK